MLFKKKLQRTHGLKTESLLLDCEFPALDDNFVEGFLCSGLRGPPARELNEGAARFLRHSDLTDLAKLIKVVTEVLLSNSTCGTKIQSYMNLTQNNAKYGHSNHGMHEFTGNCYNARNQSLFYNFTKSLPNL